ncbi:hypothetical protein QX233_17285 [Chryseobacterium gambrini]|uniref:LPXTG-motif cell wall anchor domain-containing protein n=1 Tax=Chryseobacterium gambrini TaxID=373672 RepID=A0AAJ1R8K4_9FLAO|nr:MULTISPECIES: hypothetical protein [Chryseobacterium]MDN4014229.1 hypothetical protein [Chryseobacterium gambrini]MDN4029719.1 hypothetical protein [Chryseobacterium gambrini]QWA37141.1 hypothetical protein KKI44_14510 [Chryseobacterium sp. ZHDP1]
METITTLKSKAEALLSAIFVLFMSALSFAQETKTGGGTVTTEQTTTTTTEWYANPTYIIIGAVVLIVIIALIARGGRERD